MKYLRGAAGIGLGTTIRYLRRTTSAAAGNDLGTTTNYLRRTTSGAAGSSLDNDQVSAAHNERRRGRASRAAAWAQR
jgi:hypothetical protein